MSTMRGRIARGAAARMLAAAYAARLDRLAASVLGGCGVILSMHRVIAANEPTLHPGYKIHTDELDRVLTAVKRRGQEIIPMDEVPARLQQSGHPEARRRPFVVFTSDDGYADNLTRALPVFQRHGAPICVNVSIAIIERSLFYWWGALEELVLRCDRIELPEVGASAPRVLWARNISEKISAYDTLGAMVHAHGEMLFPVLREMFAQSGVDARQLLDRDALTPSQLRALAADPLVTIGAHTVSHGRLSQMTDTAVRYELAQGRHRLEEWLGIEVRHLAYPFGRADACGAREFALAKEAGYQTAVTTRQGNIFPRHRDFLACLPRRSIPMNQVNLSSALSGVESLLRREPRFQTA